jgi:diguanylate cyclase (GGDEF)-like protein
MPNSQQLLEIIHIQTEIAKLGLDLGNVMALVVERTLSLVEADGAAVELAEGDDMVYRATSGIAKSYLGLRLKLATSLSGLCVRTGDILRCDDTENDERVDRLACRKVGLRSMIVMPLRHKGLTVGVLKAMSSQPAKFDETDMELLGLLSELIGAAMFYATKYDIDDLFHRATHDSLTGLANRALFMDRLRQEVARSDRDPQSIGVLMIDMDRLKYLNDFYGHRVGDAAIVEFSHRIRKGARTSDTVARLGGDEFGMLLVPVEIPGGAASAIERMTLEIEQQFTFDGQTYDLRASIGAAQFPNDSTDINQLIDIADQRMYSTKKQRSSQHEPKASSV